MKKSLLTFALLAAAGAALAKVTPPQQDGHGEPPKHGNFAEHKQKAIAELQSHLNCVQASQNLEQLKECRHKPRGMGSDR